MCLQNSRRTMESYHLWILVQRHTTIYMQAAPVGGRGCSGYTHKASHPHLRGMWVSSLEHRQCAFGATHPHVHACQVRTSGCMSAVAASSHTYVGCLRTAHGCSSLINTQSRHGLQASAPAWTSVKQSQVADLVFLFCGAAYVSGVKYKCLVDKTSDIYVF